MLMKDTISQLESIRTNSASFIDSEEPDSIWRKDIVEANEKNGTMGKMAVREILLRISG